MPSLPHGGRLVAARRRHPGAPQPWIDLSTGINPASFPFAPPPADAWRRLPEPEHLQELEAAAAGAYGASDPAMVVAAPGTQALIQLLPRLFPLPRIAIASPTYAEHEASWRASGTVIDPRANAAILCNPNNPDGARHDPARLAAHRMDLLVVDEAYADFEPGLSLVPHLPLPNTIVLRSFGKAYGLAGLRLGFAVAAPATASRIRQALGPWPVSGPAIAIATQAFRNPAWRDAAAGIAGAAAARLDHMLVQAGLQVLGGTALFRLAAHPATQDVAGQLAASGILVRTFAKHPTWLRLGLPGSEQEWDRLQAALGTTPPA